MIYIETPEIIITAKYEDTDGRSIKYDAEAAARRPNARIQTANLLILLQNTTKM